MWKWRRSNVPKPHFPQNKAVRPSYTFPTQRRLPTPKRLRTSNTLQDYSKTLMRVYPLRYNVVAWKALLRTYNAACGITPTDVARLRLACGLLKRTKPTTPCYKSKTKCASRWYNKGQPTRSFAQTIISPSKKQSVRPSCKPNVLRSNNA